MTIEGMPKLGRGQYPLSACVRWYVKYWQDKALGRGTDPEKEIRAQVLRNKLHESTGHLISKAQVVQVFSAAYMKFCKGLDNLPGVLGRRYGLPQDVVRSMRQEIDGFRTAFVRDSREYIDVVDDDEKPGKRPKKQ